MTIVAIWRQESYPTKPLWACSDSRISSAESKAGGDSIPLPIITHSPKIFPIHITAYENNSPTNTEVVFRHSIGLAYAGSSLFAVNVYAAICPILENLRGHAGALVSVKNVADLAASFLREFVETHAQSRPHTCPSIAMAVFGYCLVEETSVVIQLRADWRKGATGWVPTIKCESVDFPSPDFVLLLGEHTSEIRQEIQDKQQSEAPGSFRRLIAPRDAIHSIIKRGAYTGIGGTVQLFVASETGVQQFMEVDADGAKGPLPLRYLGFDTDRLGSVGPFWFSLPAVLYPSPR